MFKGIKNFIFLLILITSLTIFSQGLAWHTMICSSGTITHSMDKISDCDSFEFESDFSFSEKCCKFFYSSFQLDVFSNSFGLFILANLIILFLSIIDNKQIKDKLKNTEGVLNRKPPPKGTFSYFLKPKLSFLHCYLI